MTKDASVLEILISERNKGKSWPNLARRFEFKSEAEIKKFYFENIKRPRIKILFVDIETAPILAYVWGTGKQFVSHKMVLQPTTMLSWAAKWQGSNKIYYQDVSKQKNLRDDKKLVAGLKEKLDQADVVVWHNGDYFDKRKTNARIAVNRLQPTINYRTIDTLKIAYKHFAFDNNKLVFLAKLLGVDHQKYEHSEFAGEDLWIQCLAGNKAAWRSMRKYNPLDVLVLEDVYNRLIPHDNSINFNVYSDSLLNVCSCGSTEFAKRGWAPTNAGRYQRLKCVNCGKNHQSKVNVLKPKKRKTMLK